MIMQPKLVIFQVQALAQLLIFNLAIYIPPENVYSSQQRLESRDHPINLQCAYHFIIDAFKFKNRFSVSLDGRIPFWSIKNVGDIDKFHVALECILLVDVDTGTSQKKQHEQQLSEATTNLIENQLATSLISNSNN